VRARPRVAPVPCPLAAPQAEAGARLPQQPTLYAFSLPSHPRPMHTAAHPSPTLHAPPTPLHNRPQPPQPPPTTNPQVAVIDTLVAKVQGVPGDDRCVLMLGYKGQMEARWRGGNGQGSRAPS
jgi:hypothetical protein